MAYFSAEKMALYVFALKEKLQKAKKDTERGKGLQAPEKDSKPDFFIDHHQRQKSTPKMVFF